MSRVKPILFNTEMVRATLDKRKTVTRRIIKPQPTYSAKDGFRWKGAAYGTDLPPTVKGAAHNFVCVCPYQSGDILYVRETFSPMYKNENSNEIVGYMYKADEGMTVEEYDSLYLNGESNRV